MAAFACGLTALLYSATLGFDFVYDDRIQIVLNPLLRSWTNVWWLFKTDVWAFWNPQYVGNYWRPLFMVWLLINHTLFSLNPAGWHALAVLTHVVATWFVFQVALELSEDAMLSLFAALLFAVHPCHVETVAWVSGSTDSLMADFLLPSLLCFMRGWKNKSSKKWAWFAAAAFLFGCALLVKETGIVLAPLALCYALIFSDDDWKHRLKQACLAISPLLVVSLAYLLCRQLVLHRLAHINVPMSFGRALLSVPGLLWFYFQHLVWPVGLGPYYEIPPIQPVGWRNFGLPLLGCAVALSSFGFLAWRTRNRLMSFGALLLLLPLAPVLYIPSMPIDDFGHDRYLYFSSVGFALIVAAGVRRLQLGSGKIFGMPIFQFAGVLLLVSALSSATVFQQAFWANDLLLFRHAVDVAPGSAVAFNNLGVALTNRGRLDEARFAFEQVIKRNPNSPMALYNLGLSSFLDQDFPQAESYLLRAIRFSPLKSDTWAILADAQVRESKFVEGEASIRNAIGLQPRKPGYHKVLALALEGRGKTGEALEAAKWELTLSPDDPATKELVSRLQRIGP